MIAVEELYELYKKCSGITTDSRQIKDGVMFLTFPKPSKNGQNRARNGVIWYIIHQIFSKSYGKIYLTT